MNTLRRLIFYNCLLATLFLLCCTQKVDNRELLVDEFPDSQALRSMQLKTFEYSLPSDIKVMDTFLVLLNKMGENFFMVYDKSNMEMVAEFGTKGEGPREFYAADFYGQVIQENDENYYLVWDYQKQQVNFLNLKESIRLNSPVFTSKKLPNSLNFVGKLVHYSDTLTITVPGGEETGGRFQTFKNNVPRIIDYLPNLPFQIHENNLYRVYANVSSAIHPKRNKFVATSVLLGQYDFFDFDGNYLHSTIIDRDEELSKARFSHPITDQPVTFYYTRLIAKDSLIYSLYSTVQNSDEISTSKIHVLDWEGKPVKEYVLDCSLLSFDMDLDNNSIYGISYSQNDSEEAIHIVKFLLE